MIQTFNLMVGRMHDFTGYDNEGLLNFFYVLTIIVSQIVLLNLIISLISDTYGKVKLNFAAYRRIDRARLILEYQRRQSTSYVQQVDDQTRWTHVLSTSRTVSRPSQDRAIEQLTERVEELSSHIATLTKQQRSMIRPRGSTESRRF